jgi:hypothetical protein
MKWENAGRRGVLKTDVKVEKGEVLFPRIRSRKEIEE